MPTPSKGYEVALLDRSGFILAKDKFTDPLEAGNNYDKAKATIIDGSCTTPNVHGVQFRNMTDRRILALYFPQTEVKR